MIQKMVAVWDNALQEYLNPFFVPALGVAIRSFGDEARKQDSPIHAHPECYTLCHLGDFDTETGEITPRSDQERNKPIAFAFDYAIKE